MSTTYMNLISTIATGILHNKMNIERCAKTVTNIRKDMSQFDAADNFYILGSEDIVEISKFKEQLIKILGEQ